MNADTKQIPDFLKRQHADAEKLRGKADHEDVAFQHEQDVGKEIVQKDEVPAAAPAVETPAPVESAPVDSGA